MLTFPNLFYLPIKPMTTSSFRMSEEGSFDEGPEGLLPEADVMNLMRRMQDMNLPVSAEETQVCCLFFSTAGSARHNS